MRGYRRCCAAFLLAALLAAAASPAAARILVAIDKSAQQMTVARDGALLYRWPVSTGRPGRETPNGRFRAFRLERDHYSKEWDDAPMPHSIFFTEQGHAIHGSYEVGKIGTPASAGCVRLHPEHAARLFALVEESGVLDTAVVVTGRTPSVAAVRRHAPRAGAAREAPARPPDESLILRHPVDEEDIWFLRPPPPARVPPFPWN